MDGIEKNCLGAVFVVVGHHNYLLMQLHVSPLGTLRPEDVPPAVTVTLAGRLYIPITGFSNRAQNRLKRIAAFRNTTVVRPADGVGIDVTCREGIHQKFAVIDDRIVWYVECGVEFTNVYGDVDEALYYSIESVFMDYVKLLNSMAHDGCYKKHVARLEKLCYNASDIGWGFSEEMAAIYYEIQWRQEDD